jgi:hypothetical protein
MQILNEEHKSCKTFTLHDYKGRCKVPLSEVWKHMGVEVKLHWFLTSAPRRKYMANFTLRQLHPRYPEWTPESVYNYNVSDKCSCVWLHPWQYNNSQCNTYSYHCCCSHTNSCQLGIRDVPGFSVMPLVRRSLRRIKINVLCAENSRLHIDSLMQLGDITAAVGSG